MAAGRRSTIAFHTARAASYPPSPGWSSSPSKPSIWCLAIYRHDPAAAPRETSGRPASERLLDRRVRGLGLEVLVVDVGRALAAERARHPRVLVRVLPDRDGAAPGHRQARAHDGGVVVGL